MDEKQTANRCNIKPNLVFLVMLIRAHFKGHDLHWPVGSLPLTPGMHIIFSNAPFGALILDLVKEAVMPKKKLLLQVKRCFLLNKPQVRPLGDGPGPGPGFLDDPGPGFLTGLHRL
jgi:hypothetical protein